MKRKTNEEKRNEIRIAIKNILALPDSDFKTKALKCAVNAKMTLDRVLT